MSFLAPKATYTLWTDNSIAHDMSLPPPKPPRGVMRKAVTPLAEVGNSTPVNSPKLGAHQFSGLERRRQMIEEFRTKLDVNLEEEFNGRDALEAMMEVVTEDSPQKVTDDQAREKALRVLDVWLQENVIRPEQSSGKEWVEEFRNDKKTKYYLNQPENYRIVMVTPRARSTSRDRNPVRRGSIKRLFRIGSTDNGESPKPTLFGDDPADVENPRLFGKLANRFFPSEEHNLKDEALMFDTALRCLLLEVDVPVLDGVMNVKDYKDDDSVSFMSGLLRRMGLGSEPRVFNSEAVFTFIQNCPHLRRRKDVVVAWFRRCVECAPSLHLDRHAACSDHSQIHDWAKMAVRGVVENFTHITNHARNPLIPNEFAPFLLAVTEQLCNRHTDAHRRDRVLHLLWLMIPSRMRRHLNELLDLIAATANTDSSFNFRDPFFVDKQAQDLGDNYWFLIDELRRFIVPSTLSQDKQISIIQMYMHVRTSRNLDSVPSDLLGEMANKQQKTPGFCRAERETVDDAEKRVVEMVDAIVKSNAYTPQRKKEMLEICRHDHPQIMATHFRDVRP